MTLTEPQKTLRKNSHAGEPKPGRRVGYTVSIIVNAVMLFVTVNLLEWGWFDWLTDEFDRVVPWAVFSLSASIAVTAIYMAFDAPWFKSLTQAALAVISFIVTLRIWNVFPFDFTGYDGPWTGFTEVILLIVLVGSAMAAVIESARFIIRLATSR